MQLLLRRSQTKPFFRRPVFKLWAQLEFEHDEVALIQHYRFQGARLIETVQPGLLRRSAFAGGITLAFLTAALWQTNIQLAGIVGAVGGLAVGWLYYDFNRETIYVKDLIHGRFFRCRSVIELARKEAWLGVVTSFLRQVMESAKHWDGTEAVPIDALSKEEAKYAVIRGL
jgi:hypothetical protein